MFHLWGMTELSPLGTISGTKAALMGRSQEQLLANKSKQGRCGEGRGGTGPHTPQQVWQWVGRLL